MRLGAALLAPVVAIGSLMLTSQARAACPDTGSPTPSVCEPHAAMLVPSVEGVAFFPHESDKLGGFLGGGLEILLFTWSNSAETFGPAQGKIRLDVAGLASTKMDVKPMVFWRGGASVSFERNPSRNWLIPYFGADLGGFYQRDTGGKFFVDGSLGLYAVYTKNFILDAEGSWILPFTLFDVVNGPKAQLTMSFQLW